MGHPPLTRWDRAAFERLRSGLHARHDAPLATAHATFAVSAGRRLTPGGLTRTVRLHLRPGPGSDTRGWALETRTWAGRRVEHRTLDQVAAEIDAVLEAVRRIPPHV